MQLSAFNMELAWKDFNIDTAKAQADIIAITPLCVGVSCHSKFVIHFSSEPDQVTKDAIQSYWDKIKKTQVIAKNYQSAADAKKAADDAKALAKASATAKLKALGLTDEEISAIQG